MLALHFLDWTVIALYLLAMAVIGSWTAVRIRDMGDFFMPRRFGKFILTMYGFGTGTHSDQAVGVASKTYTSGLSGIWYQWLYLFSTPFYWLIAPIMRRFRAITTADVYELRYNRSVAMLFSLVGCAYLTTSIGTMLKGSAAIIHAGTGSFVSADIAIAAMTVIFVLYGAAGGLAAAILTDYIQGILTVIFSFLLLPFVLSAVGGLSGLRQSIADEHMFSLVAPGDITLFYVLVISINGLIGIVAQPHIMGNCAPAGPRWTGASG